jgi:hypothetical protein
MATIERTVSPHLTNQLTRVEIEESYTPTQSELDFVRTARWGASTRLTMLAQVKTFQRLGYFPVAVESI